MPIQANQPAMKAVAFFFLFVLLSTFSSAALSEQNCAIIQCDCASLPMDSWKNVCKERELKLVSQCKQGKALEGLYCLAHGPEANRLPLAMSLDEVAVLPVDKLPKLFKKVAVLYWSNHKDLQVLEHDFDSAEYEQAENRLRVIVENIDTLFRTQQQIAVSWRAYEKDEEARDAWKDFSSDTLDAAHALLTLAKVVWTHSGSQVGEARIQSEAIAKDLFTKSAEVYEQSAYAFGQAGQHDNAARTWWKAAGVSEFLLEVSSADNPQSQDVQFLKYQRAAQLYRASFHWVKEEREGEAKNSLKEAQELFDGSEAEVTG